MKKLALIAFVLIIAVAVITSIMMTQEEPESTTPITTSSAGTFHISQWDGYTWQVVYNHQFPVHYSTEEFAFNAIDGNVKLRIVQTDLPFADIDQIKLVACGQDITPQYARYTADSQDIRDDILEIDHNVVLAHDQEIEVFWKMPDGCEQSTLFLNANEYGHGSPFQFPLDGYASYEMGSNYNSITVDGNITESDGTTPLYSPFWKPATGHPDGYTHIYVCDDSENVYFSLDATGDNTCEFGEDWAEIRILTPEGTEQLFRINDFDDTWGKVRLWNYQ